MVRPVLCATTILLFLISPGFAQHSAPPDDSSPGKPTLTATAPQASPIEQADVDRVLTQLAYRTDAIFIRYQGEMAVLDGDVAKYQADYYRVTELTNAIHEKIRLLERDSVYERLLADRDTAYQSAQGDLKDMVAAAVAATHTLNELQQYPLWSFAYQELGFSKAHLGLTKMPPAIRGDAKYNLDLRYIQHRHHFDLTPELLATTTLKDAVITDLRSQVLSLTPQAGLAKLQVTQELAILRQELSSKDAEATALKAQLVQLEKAKSGASENSAPKNAAPAPAPPSSSNEVPPGPNPADLASPDKDVAIRALKAQLSLLQLQILDAPAEASDGIAKIQDQIHQKDAEIAGLSFQIAQLADMMTPALTLSSGPAGDNWAEASRRAGTAIYQVVVFAGDEAVSGTAFACFIGPNVRLVTAGHVASSILEFAGRPDFAGAFAVSSASSGRVTVRNITGAYVDPRYIPGSFDTVDIGELTVDPPPLSAMRLSSCQRLNSIPVGTPIGVLGFPGEITEIQRPVPTFLKGSVSALRPLSTGSSTQQIQFDMGVVPGDSGAPIYQADGTVIGVVSSYITRGGADTPYHFAIRIDAAAGFTCDPRAYIPVHFNMLRLFPPPPLLR